MNILSLDTDKISQHGLFLIYFKLGQFFYDLIQPFLWRDPFFVLIQKLIAPENINAIFEAIKIISNLYHAFSMNKTVVYIKKSVHLSKRVILTSNFEDFNRQKAYFLYHISFCHSFVITKHS